MTTPREAAVQRRAVQWARLLDELADILGRLRRDGPELLYRAALPSRPDSTPAGTGGAESHGGGTSDPVLGAVVASLDGHLFPHVDERTGAQSWDTRDPDPVATAVHEMRQLLLGALRAARRADDARRRALWVPSAERPLGRPEAPACVTCERADVYTVAARAGRCPACLEHRESHDGADARPAQVLERPENATPGQRRARVKELPPAVAEALRRHR